MSDRASGMGSTPMEPVPSAELFADEIPHSPVPMGPTRYQRRSGSLPHLEDQPGTRLSMSELPSPVSSRHRALDRLRRLISL